MLNNPLISRRAELLEANIDGDVVGLHIASGTCFGFNSTATRVWEILAEPARFDALCDQLTREFSVDAEHCRRDVLALLLDMRDAGLVELSADLPANAE